MLPGSALRRAFAGLLLLASGATASASEFAKPEIDDGESVDRILSDWARVSATRTGLDVRFEREDRDIQWRDHESYAGRVLLLPKGAAMVEMRTHARAGQPVETERLVWTADEFHQLRHGQKKHLIYPITEKDRGRLPAALALPFFWHLSVEGLKSRYRVELVKENRETWLLRITPLTKIGREGFSTAFLYLDRSTYLPRRYCVVGPDSKSTQDFRVTQVQSASLPPENLLATPKDGEWTVSRADDRAMGWLSSLFKPELLP